MNTAANRINGKVSDVPLTAAVLAAGAVAALFFWLKSPRTTELLAVRVARFGEINTTPLLVLSALLLGNVIWLAIGAKQHARATRDEERGVNEVEQQNAPNIVMVIVKNVSAYALGCALGWYASRHQLAPKSLPLLPVNLTLRYWDAAFTTNAGFAGLGTLVAGQWGFRKLTNRMPAFSRRLPRIMPIHDGIILGAVHEEVMRPVANVKPAIRWIYQGLRGLTGNLFLSGSIGSGKSQILLRLLQQILALFAIRPSLLAIDPKRTFVRELRKIIEAQGKAEHLLWVSLDGEVKFNPIWRESMLKNSAFTSIANSLRLASINFIGSSGDSRFWEQSSFNLLKNSLVYCAATLDYFTFRHLYAALVKARDEGLGAELSDSLKKKEWDPEERDNIVMAINYFKEEFSQMDQKIRTSILATATGFLNEFLEYRVSCILSPEKKDITLHSIGQAIREGKLICLYIENESLARSIGTLFKLLYQEAVLERVDSATDPRTCYAVLVMDEYQDVATSGGGVGLGDDRYLAKARESKAITIAATQSVSSLENAVRSEPATREILQNFRTRIFGNSTDPKTIRLFQEPHGQVDRERHSHSVSESAQNARPDLLFGGHSSDRTSRSESFSTHMTQEYPITAREFSRLRPFESFAQVFDGVETQFEKLFLKPFFLKDMRTPHRKLMKLLRKAAEVKRVKRRGLSALLGLVGLNLVLAATAHGDALFPNACSVIKSNEFMSCFDFQVGACMCPGIPPRPCAQISYYVPQTFVEVWPDSGDSFFKSHPAAFQLGLHKGELPFGAEDDNATFSFHAHAIAVPLMSSAFSPLSCDGTRSDKACFDLMSEDLGSNWHEGKADLLQPAYLAWQLSPKACILKGAAQGLAGIATPSFGIDSGGCSYPQGLYPKYPPSTQDACNGWGVFFPRYGVYHGASRTGAALMIAARLKSVGTEVSHTIPSDPDEYWQMLYPQGSSCFKEGQNIGLLETIKGAREEQRLFGKPKGYLFVVWKKTSCCRDIEEAPENMIAVQALRLACQAVPGGGI